VTAAEYRAAYTRPIQDFYHRLFGRQLEDGEFVGLDDAFHDAYRGTMAGVTLATGSRQALRDWRLGGRTQSLLSMFRHEQLVTLVGRYGIQDEFVRIDGLVGPGGGRKAEHLTRHLAALHLDPAAALLVGRQPGRCGRGRRGRRELRLFNGGYHDRSALEVAGVPIADTMAEVLSLAAAPR